MMKKLMVLVMVLGLVSAAQAGIVGLRSDKVNNEVKVDDVVTVTVFNSANFAGGPSSNFKMTVSNSINGSVAKLGTWFMAPSPMSVTASGNGQIFQFGTGTCGLPAAAGDWLQLTFTVPSTQGLKYGDIINLTTTSGKFMNETPSMALTVVPEPMTIGLLGLGGLFLRRKNKK